MSRKVWGISRAFASPTFLLATLVCAQQTESSQPAGHEELLTIHLQADAGTPLRAYLTNHVWYRQDEPVTAKLIEPIWSFDRQIVPAGAVLQGHITQLLPVPKMMRARAILGGDFTPLKKARITFTSIVLPDGQTVEIQALPSFGLGTYYVPPRPKQGTQKTQTSPKPSNALVETAKQQMQAELQQQSRGIYDLVRAPNKREWLEDWLMTKLPYHPQWYRSGMRIDSILAQDTGFGTAQVPVEDLKQVGTAPPPDSTAQMRMVATATSADAKVGDPLRGVLAQPLFNSKNELVLPQGTELLGKITLARRARMFHRGGKLRFAIEDFQLPPEAAQLAAVPAEPTPTRAQLAAIEPAPAAAMKVDEEGTAAATESKTRLIRPVIAALIATKSLDNDAGRQTATGSGPNNAPARGLAGFSGFGLLGWAASKGPHPVSAALGFYGLGWSIYNNVISRGIDVTLEKDSEAAIRFGPASRPK